METSAFVTKLKILILLLILIVILLLLLLLLLLLIVVSILIDCRTYPELQDFVSRNVRSICDRAGTYFRGHSQGSLAAYVVARGVSRPLANVHPRDVPA
jgi:hypothetical protein